MTELASLRALASDPDAQAAYAAELLDPRQRPDVLLAAVTVLVRTPTPAARPGLLAVYGHLSADGPRRDPGAYTRRAVLDALRPLVVAEDVPLLCSATETYEFLPPRFKEDAGLLRSGALLCLAAADDTVARYHAARLLVDEHTAPMSGEPALTAARVLAAVGELVSLYQYVVQPCGMVPEVASECLRSLIRLPGELVPGLVARYRESESAILCVGLYDLLIRHERGPLHVEYLQDSLSRQKDLDAFRYLVIALLSARRPELDDMVLDAAVTEPNGDRRAVLDESLALFVPAGASREHSRRRSRRSRAP